MEVTEWPLAGLGCQPRSSNSHICPMSGGGGDKEVAPLTRVFTVIATGIYS